jgi:Flp pilus assembly protein TadG
MSRYALAGLKWLRGFVCDTSAASAAEFALVLPIFLLLTLGTISVGILLSAITQMHFAAEKAARCLSVDVAGNCPATDSAIDTYAKKFYQGPALSGLTFSGPPSPLTNPLSCGNQVNARGSYQFLTGVSRSTVNLSASACYAVI